MKRYALLILSALLLSSPALAQGPGPSWHKPGTRTMNCLRPQTRSMIAQLVKRIGPIAITSTCGGRHVAHSEHYRGNAIDFKPINVSHAQALAALRAMPIVGGIGNYPSHIHADVGALKHAWNVGGARRHYAGGYRRYASFRSHRPGYYRMASYQPHRRW